MTKHTVESLQRSIIDNIKDRLRKISDLSDDEEVVAHCELALEELEYFPYDDC